MRKQHCRNKRRKLEKAEKITGSSANLLQHCLHMQCNARHNKGKQKRNIFLYAISYYKPSHNDFFLNHNLTRVHFLPPFMASTQISKKGYKGISPLFLGHFSSGTNAIILMPEVRKRVEGRSQNKAWALAFLFPLYCFLLLNESLNASWCYHERTVISIISVT